MILTKKVSSFFSLLFISLLAFTLGTVIVVKSKNLEKLEQPLVFDYAVR